jgi:hypothetical protein
MVNAMTNLLRAVIAADVTADLAPKPVQTSAQRLLSAIKEREQADAEWVAAKDKLNYTQATQADAIAQARIRNRPEPAVVSIEQLQRELEAKMIERDVTNQLVATVEREHAEAVAANADEWRAAIDAEEERLRAEVATHAAAIEAAFDRIDQIVAVRAVAVETTPRRLYRLKRPRFTGKPREGLKPIHAWLTPPEPPRTPVRALNFGNQELMSDAAREFVGPEEW